MRSAVILAILVLAVPATTAAQHETASDIADGGTAYRSSCANCHGPDGDVIAGIDLGRGQFRRQLSDDDLVRIIRQGIPNTPMPASNMSEEQAKKLVAYLRSLPAARAGSVTGNPARGEALFAGKGGCTNCHRVDGAGSRLGPDLTGVGAVRRAAEIERALLEPAADVQPAHRFYRVVTKDGTEATGRLLNHDTFTVQLLDRKEQLRSFQKSDLREHGFIESPMPSYRDRLAPQEIADVVSYLTSLKAR